MNKPYVKQYKSGELLNPIEKSYSSLFPNRRARRDGLSKKRFHGESKNYHLTVTDAGKYRRVRQQIICWNKELKKEYIKTIEHYILRN